FEGQVEILEPLLRIRRLEALPELRRQPALLLDALQHCGAPLLELAQVFQPLLQRAQLRVVEAARGLLSIARNEWHRSATVEQCDGGNDLRRFDGKLGGDAGFDGDHAAHYAQTSGAQQGLRTRRDLYSGR